MVKANPTHEVAHQELTDLLKRHADEGDLSALEMLAVAANMVGKLIALQDQRVVTPGQALDVVTANIKIGNAQVVDLISKPRGRA